MAAIERVVTKQRKVAEELARRAQAIERGTGRGLGRSWLATRNEILGRPR